VHELIAADDDADVRRARSDGAEEDEIAGLELIAIHRFTDAELLAYLARHGHTVLLVDVLHEPAAIEAARIIAADTVGRSSQRECRSG
jgi:hypothetical protein